MKDRCATNADCKLGDWQGNLALKLSNPNPNLNPNKSYNKPFRVRVRVRVRALPAVCKSTVCVCRTPVKDHAYLVSEKKAGLKFP